MMAKSLWLRVKLIVGLVLSLIIIHVINTFSDGLLNRFGVIPRSIDTWYHIALAPFIHGSYGHLINNLIGLIIFSAICLVRPISFYIAGSIFIILLTGLLVWFFGRESVHIGASGWVFGLWSLSIATAWFDRSLKNIGIALLVAFYYGGMIYGVLPTQPGVSFESHLFGVVSGISFAALGSKVAVLRRDNGSI